MLRPDGRHMAFNYKDTKCSVYTVSRFPPLILHFGLAPIEHVPRLHRYEMVVREAGSFCGNVFDWLVRGVDIDREKSYQRLCL